MLNVKLGKFIYTYEWWEHLEQRLTQKGLSKYSSPANKYNLGFICISLINGIEHFFVPCSAPMIFSLLRYSIDFYFYFFFLLICKSLVYSNGAHCLILQIFFSVGPLPFKLLCHQLVFNIYVDDFSISFVTSGFNVLLLKKNLLPHYIIKYSVFQYGTPIILLLYI